MKSRNILLTAIMAVALIGGSVRADLDLSVDPGATQLAWVNAYNISDDTFAWDFGYNPDLTTSAFIGNTQVLGPNTDIYTANGGGTAGENASWFTGDGSGTQTKYITALTYHEADSSSGTTVNYDYSVLANTLLANGYTGQGFIKVLDPDAGWATVQTDYLDLTTLGAKSQSLLIGDGGATYVGTPKVQVGFAITGLYVDPATAAGLGTVEVIPEPATLGLIGLFGAGLLLFRRNFKI